MVKNYNFVGNNVNNNNNLNVSAKIIIYYYKNILNDWPLYIYPQIV